jgi:hypothetical protein
MNRTLGVGLLGPLLVLGGPLGASAQAAIVAAAGVTAPVASYDDYAATGWLTHAGITLPVSEQRLSVGAEAIFGRNGHGLPEGDKAYLWGAVGTVNRAFGSAEGLSPFVFGMVGLLVESFRSDTQPGLNASEASLAMGGGGGVAFPAAAMTAYVNAWLLNGFRNGDDVMLFGVTTGLKLPLDRL